MAEAKITLDQVRHVARLARLALDDQQLQTLTPQLESILEFMEVLNTVDVSDVPPMEHVVNLHNVLREDVAGAALPLEDVLRNAPQTDGPFFRVPKVLGGDEDSAG